MRKYKFRGISLQTGEFVYGYYGELTDGEITKSYIMTNTLNFNPSKNIYFTDNAVDHETVGQYIGLTDKNGVDIYEGDIVNGNNKIFIVEWGIEEAGFYLYEGYHGSSIYFPIESKLLEVIGNIHQNPELLAEESV